VSDNCKYRFSSLQTCMRDKIEDNQIWTQTNFIKLNNFLLHCGHHSTIQITQAKIQIKHVFKQQPLLQTFILAGTFYRNIKSKGRHPKILAQTGCSFWCAVTKLLAICAPGSNYTHTIDKRV
jgi:hypothetical protein